MGYDKASRPRVVRTDRLAPDVITISTAASTSLEPRGVYALVTAVTSSGAPVVYTLQAPRTGDVLEMNAVTLVSSSQAPFHINGGSAVFGYATASTGHDMVTLSTQGSGFRAIAKSSSEWLVTGIRAATFSTST